jgi:asparagine synthase (glutamine-hydrolysing)
MCGIAGAIGIRDGAALVEAMTGALRHRGPDGAGYHSRGRHHLGSTRLSIVDLGAGVQPLYNETGQTCVIFNGEIYNHRQLRAELQRKGHIFATQTDTEVIVHLYEEVGDDVVRHLDGMFAFAVLDAGRLLLARDPLGIKPLYFAYLPERRTFLFASEIKAILRHPGFAARLNLQAVADAIALGYPVGDETYFEGIRSLPPGHTMRVFCDEDAFHVDGPARYHTSAAARDNFADIDEAQAALEATLDAAVNTHLAADVDVGLTLSGGIDSTLLALLARRHVRQPLFTFAVADHDNQPDFVEAAHVARLIESTHRSVVMTFDDYLDVIPGLIEGEEQPSSLYGAPFYFLCRTIACDVKAVLHGEGADELFGGYTPYIDRDSRLAFIKHRLRLLKPLGVAPSGRAIESIRALAGAAAFDEYLERLFADNMGDPLERQHLVPIDKCAMASGVEIRVPYLDRAVVDLVSRMPFRFLVKPELAIRKYILRRLVLSRFGIGLLDVVLREKLGAPAAGKAHLERFTRLCDEMLPDQYVERHEFGRVFTSKRELILFDMFLEVFTKHRGDSSGMGSVIEFIRARASGGSSVRARVRDERAASAVETEVPLS